MAIMRRAEEMKRMTVHAEGPEVDASTRMSQPSLTAKCTCSWPYCYISLLLHYRS